MIERSDTPNILSPEALRILDDIVAATVDMEIDDVMSALLTVFNSALEQLPQDVMEDAVADIMGIMLHMVEAAREESIPPDSQNESIPPDSQKH